MSKMIPILCALAVAAAGCSDDDTEANTSPSSSAGATAALEARSGNTTLKGKVEFVQDDGKVRAVLSVEGAPPGEHGAHIHALGDCSAADAMSAGGHWNPQERKHGDFSPAAATHLGDLGNLTVGEDGKGTLERASEHWTIGDGTVHDLVGKAVVIHMAADDLMTDPAGNSGARIGCGAIAATAD